MNQSGLEVDCTRRDFIRGGSCAALATVLGGVELTADTKPAAVGTKRLGPKVKVAVIGTGTRGREILNTLARMDPADAQPEVAAVCDTYAATLSRAGNLVPGAARTPDYTAILADQQTQAVLVATPTHQHAEVVLAALRAGKHVYCEAPLANTIQDARTIAAAAKACELQVFQAGLQLRSDPLRCSLLRLIRAGSLGQMVRACGQWHKKTSWRSVASRPERARELNWRLDQEVSLGLVGELGCGTIDLAAWFMNAQPVAVTGFGGVALWKDGRTVPDTAQVLVEFPGGLILNYEATLANSFDGDYEIFYGAYAALVLRQNRAWLFKEVDSPLLGWEVYSRKETFHGETGIVLRAGPSGSTDLTEANTPPYTNTPLSFALLSFLRNTADVVAMTEYAATMGITDPGDVAEVVRKVGRRPAAGYLEGFRATVTAIKANEAVVKGQRIDLQPEWYDLGGTA